MEKKIESIDVNFESMMSKNDFSVCDACGNVSRVIKIALPKTKYWEVGKEKETRWELYWLCENCHKKLLYALENPIEVER